MLKYFINIYVLISTMLVTGVIAMFVTDYIQEIIKEQKVIKLLCKHKYEPHNAYYCVDGIEYDFKCKKCGKIITIETVTRDKFDWYKDNFV